MSALNAEAVKASLLKRDDGAFQGALRAAVSLGSEGDRILAEVVAITTGWRRVAFVAALGDVTGPQGGPVLSAVIGASGPGTRHLRIAATLALAKREHEHASGELTHVLGDRDHSVRHAALIGLAAYGDHRAVNAVRDLLRKMTARQRHLDSHLPTVALAAIYLARHSHAEDVQDLLRARANRLSPEERRWFGQHWPGAIRNHPGQVDPVVLHQWLLADPLISTPSVW